MATRNNRKKRSGGRLSVRRRKRVSDSVFGDLAVPSLHDVTLKMQRATDAAEDALLSFKPINYRRIHKIHKRWKNKKYRIVSGGTKDEEEDALERELVRKQKGVEDAEAALERAKNPPSQDVNEDDDSCVKSRNNPEYTLNVTSNKTFAINRKGPNDFQALMLELANSGNNTDVVVEEDEIDESSGAPSKAVPIPPSIHAVAASTPKTLNPLASEIPVDVAAAVAGAAAGAAAAAALFTDDHTAVIVPKTPTLSAFTITPDSVTIGGGVAPTFTKVNSASKGVITYTSSDITVAAIDAGTGVITLVAPGNVTFTANQAADPTNNFAAAAPVTSTTLTVMPAAPPEEEEEEEEEEDKLEWAELKRRWVEVHGKCIEIKYKDDLKKDAGSSNTPPSTLYVKRETIFDWLKISDPSDIVFDVNESRSKNRELYTALNDWIEKWNAYSGKIRTIISIKGGGGSESGDAKPTIVSGNKLNTTKVNFTPSLQDIKYTVPEGDQKNYSLKKNQYGNFYAGFEAGDTNAERYEKGNFKDLIETLEQGGNAAIFGYGYSGSGKTYTLTNYNADKPQEHGIAIQLLQDLLSKQNDSAVAADKKISSINLSISELYCSDFTINAKHEVDFKSTTKKNQKKIRNSETEISIQHITDFTECITKVKQDLIKESHIKYTLNNPESSRGHLFYKFEITIKSKKSVLTIVDMGGRENPVELSESSYMVTKAIKDTNGDTAPIGQIVERVSATKAVFYSKLSTGYPSEANKMIMDSNICAYIRHITGEHADSWSNKCSSIIASSFGELFFNSYLVAFNEYKYDKLSLSLSKPTLDDKKVLAELGDKIKLFLEACKEGLYINETINHLVAYINFLSNISKMKDIIDNIAISPNNGIISLDRINTRTTQTVYKYHPERYITNPLRYIKAKDVVKDKDDKTKLQVLLADDDIYDKIKDVGPSDDDVGILSELWDIKNPTQPVPAIICFIACVRNDNTLSKNQTATKATLDFAMSVSASNAPPSSDPVVLSMNMESEEHVVAAHVPQAPYKTKAEFDDVVNRISNVAPAKIKKMFDDYIKTEYANTKPGTVTLVGFVDELMKHLTSQLKEYDNERLPDDDVKQARIIEPAMKRWLKHIYTVKHELKFLKDGFNINKPNKYPERLRKIISDANTANGGSGAKVKTRKRESRREKKNRMTRRRV